MTDYLGFQRTLLEIKARDPKKFMDTLEQLYFVSVRNTFSRLCRTELFHVAKDVINLETYLQAGARDALPKMQSNKLREDPFMRDLSVKSQIEDYEKRKIMLEIIEPNRVVVTAVFFAELLKKGEWHARYRVIVGVLLGAITALLASILKTMGEVYVGIQ